MVDARRRIVRGGSPSLHWLARWSHFRQFKNSRLLTRTSLVELKVDSVKPRRAKGLFRYATRLCRRIGCGCHSIRGFRFAHPPVIYSLRFPVLADGCEGLLPLTPLDLVGVHSIGVGDIVSLGRGYLAFLCYKCMFWGCEFE